MFEIGKQTFKRDKSRIGFFIFLKNLNLEMRVYAIIRRYYDIYGKRNKAVRVLGSRYSLETLLRRLKSLTGRTYITTKYYFVPFISFSSIVKSLNFH